MGPNEPWPKRRRPAHIFEGSARCDIAGEPVAATRLVVLGDGDRIEIQSEAGARLVLITGAPFREPIVPYGPFVMNTVEEIQQTLIDLQQGTSIKP